MGGGYFDDGTTPIELGSHAFVTASERRHNLMLEPPGVPACVQDAGGGLLALQVTAHRLWQDLGQAEWWLYERLRQLALSGPGTLGCEDGAGRRVTFGRAVCLGGVGRVRGFRLAELRLDFAAPAEPTAPAWQTPPEPPIAPPGTASAQDYAVGGVQIGTHPAEMRIRMARRFPLITVPRAWGARSRRPQWAARMHLVVRAHALPADQDPSDYLVELARQIGPRPVDLTANGNTYPAVVLDELRADHADGPARQFEARFMVAVPDDRPTTTPAPYPTTTTVAPTTTTAGPSAANCGVLDAGAVQDIGAARNCGDLDSGALQES